MDAAAHQEIARGLFRESNDVLILFDPQTHRVVDINPTAQRLTGFNRKAARTLKVWDLFEAEPPRTLQELMEAYQNTGFFHSREGFWLRPARGEPIPVNVSVSRIHTRPEPLGLTVARDVSHQRRAQEEMDRFFRLAPDLFSISEHFGKLIKLNPAWEQTLGHPLSSLLGTTPYQWVHPDDREATLEAARSLERQEVWYFVNRWRHRDGSYRFLSWRAVLVGGLVYSVARDVTETLRLQEVARQTEALRLAKEAAEQASMAKTQFLAGVSHEIRTPMTAILGFAEVLLDDESVKAGPPMLREALRTIQQNGLHLRELINDLLDLSRIEAGRPRVELAACSPRGIAEEVVASLRSRAAAKGLQLTVEPVPPLPEVIRTDRLRLRQVLMNLLGNAIKYTERGSVRLGLRRVDDSTLGPCLLCEVADTGIGMTPEVQSRLFEPFYRVENGSDDQKEGTGLGLAISRRLVELLGGRLDLESQLGVGSTFRITLPLGAAGPGAPLEPSAPSPPTAFEGQILVAEDNPVNRKVLTLMLERAGARVEPAQDGAEAVAKALAAWEAGHPFDVILMDMQMPRLDGFGATRELRARGYPGAILALTAYAMAEDRAESLKVGCDDHLSKPVDRAHLFEAVAPYLTRRS